MCYTGARAVSRRLISKCRAKDNGELMATEEIFRKRENGRVGEDFMSSDRFWQSRMLLSLVKVLEIANTRS